MSSPFSSSRLKEFIGRLEAQSIEYRNQQKKQLEDEKAKLTRSCRQIQPSKKTSWQTNLHRKDLFQTQYFLPYKYVPRPKQEQLLFPDRILEKGNKRFFIKMKDSSLDCFPNCETEKQKKVLHRQQKQLIIEDRRLQELNKILDDNDGKLRAKRFKRMLENRHKFVVPTGHSDYLSQYPGFLKESQLPQTELLRKTSLARNNESNKWRPNSRMSRDFARTAKSQAMASIMITKPLTNSNFEDF